MWFLGSASEDFPHILHDESICFQKKEMNIMSYAPLLTNFSPESRDGICGNPFTQE
jgi:hypothetical protein